MSLFLLTFLYLLWNSFCGCLSGNVNENILFFWLARLKKWQIGSVLCIQFIDALFLASSYSYHWRLHSCCAGRKWKEPSMEICLYVKWTAGEVGVCHAKSAFVLSPLFKKQLRQTYFILSSAPPHCLLCRDWFWEYSSHLCTHVLAQGIEETWFQPRLTRHLSPPPLYALFCAIDWIIPNLWACSFLPGLPTSASWLVPNILSGTGSVLWFSRESRVERAECRDAPSGCATDAVYVCVILLSVMLSSLNIIKNLMGIVSNSSQGDSHCRECD